MSVFHYSFARSLTFRSSLFAPSCSAPSFKVFCSSRGSEHARLLNARHQRPEDAESAVFNIQQCVSVDGVQPTQSQHGQDREPMWTGTKYNVSKILSVCCHSLTLRGAPVVASDAVRVLGVMLTA